MRKIYKEANTTASSSGGVAGGVGFSAGQGATYSVPDGWSVVKRRKRPYSTEAMDYVQAFPKYRMAKSPPIRHKKQV